MRSGPPTRAEHLGTIPALGSSGRPSWLSVGDPGVADGVEVGRRRRSSMPPSVRVTVLAPASGTRSSRHHAAERLAEDDVEPVRRVVVDDLAEPRATTSSASNASAGRASIVNDGDVVGEPRPGPRHAARAARRRRRSAGDDPVGDRRRPGGRRRPPRHVGEGASNAALSRRIAVGRAALRVVGVAASIASRRRAARSSTSLTSRADAEHRVRVVAHRRVDVLTRHARRATSPGAPSARRGRGRRAACGAAVRGGRPARRA